MRGIELNRWQGWGITALRVVVGIVFLMHGAQKLFVHGIGGVAGGFANAGFPLPGVSAAVVTLVEFFGGIALLLGLLTRWAALLLAINMAVAVLAVHLRQGFFLPRGYEYALTLLAASAALVLNGSGELALDNLLWRRRRRELSTQAV